MAPVSLRSHSKQRMQFDIFMWLFVNDCLGTVHVPVFMTHWWSLLGPFNWTQAMITIYNIAVTEGYWVYGTVVRPHDKHTCGAGLCRYCTTCVYRYWTGVPKLKRLLPLLKRIFKTFIIKHTQIILTILNPEEWGLCRNTVCISLLLFFFPTWAGNNILINTFDNFINHV